ncbi:MAG: T9SS type A sorting domain-containing protein [Flavobacteriales bacterium]|nr:T9SS type A sorting domain-containing protein [Flavobacteriales bacterium]
MKNLSILYAALTVLFSLNATGQVAGTLDQSFGDNGIVTTDAFPGPANAFLANIHVQTDGKMVAVGYYSPFGSETPYRGIAISRYQLNGELDPSFGENGIVNVASYELASIPLIPFIRSSILTNANEIICVGRFTTDLNNGLLIAKFDSNGNLDSTFGNNGIATENFGFQYIDPTKVLVLNDGKLLIGGTATGTGFVARFMPNGIVDSSFGNNGIFNVAHAVDNIGTDFFGRVLCTGENHILYHWEIGVTRILPDGSLDSGFGTNGTASFYLSEASNLQGGIDRLQSLHVFLNGDMLIGGGCYESPQESTGYCLIKVKRTGQLDSTFADNGILKFNPGEEFAAVQAILVQADGKIIGVGETLGNYNQVFRLNLNGSFDNSFGTNGLFDFTFRDDNQVTCGAIQIDQKLLVGGISGNPEQEYERDFAIARILTDLNIGIVEFSRNVSNTLLYPNPIQEQATFQYELTESEKLSISLFDMEGRIIKTFLSEKEQQTGKHQLALDFPKGLHSGTYLLSISSEKGQMGIRVIKD